MISAADLARMTPADREGAEEFLSFLEAVGPRPTPGAPETYRRLAEWIEADPEPRLRYLGVTREWARENGCRV